jgi:hypothetical protein
MLTLITLVERRVCKFPPISRFLKHFKHCVPKSLVPSAGLANCASASTSEGDVLA